MPTRDTLIASQSPRNTTPAVGEMAVLWDEGMAHGSTVFRGYRHHLRYLCLRTRSPGPAPMRAHPVDTLGDRERREPPGDRRMAKHAARRGEHPALVPRRLSRRPRPAPRLLAAQDRLLHGAPRADRKAAARARCIPPSPAPRPRRLKPPRQAETASNTRSTRQRRRGAAGTIGSAA